MSVRFQMIQAANLVWQDGVPYSNDFEDRYFSAENGLEESFHVFIQANQLIERWQTRPAEETREFVIGETGFGTGLNFLLTWSLWEKYASESSQLRFVSCEQYPLSHSDLIRALAQWPQLGKYAQALIEHYPTLTPGFHLLKFESARVSLLLMLGDALASYQQLLSSGDPTLESQLRRGYMDAWFLDGFSPAKNPTMWSEELFSVLSLLSKNNTTLATFSAAGLVKRGLERNGFKVRRTKGFGRKRQMISAKRVEKPLSPFPIKRHTPWHLAPSIHDSRKRAVIVGAGLAGCFCAYALKSRGWQVHIIDERGQAGEGASGNPQAVLFPRLSAYRAPLTEWMLSAYLYATRIYQALFAHQDCGALTGLLQLADTAQALQHQNQLKAWLQHYPTLGMLVDREEASRLAGIPIHCGGLYVPHSGWFRSNQLCQILLRLSGIEEIEAKRVECLQFSERRWHLNQDSAEVVILANGVFANQFKQTDHLPLKPIRGQMTQILATEASSRLNLPICGTGHVLPAHQNVHSIGATYHLNDQNPIGLGADDQFNLDQLNRLPTESVWSGKVLGHWSGVRAATPDYLPLVGAVTNPLRFKKIFAAFSTNSKRWIAQPNPAYPGLYVCAGFGSRGLTSIPLSAEYLASMINGELDCLPRHLIQAISPARFLKKTLVMGR